MSKYAKPSWTDNIPPLYLPFVLIIFQAIAFLIISLPIHHLLISGFISSAIALLPAILIKAKHPSPPVSKLLTTAISIAAVGIYFSAVTLIAIISDNLSADIIILAGSGGFVATILATTHILRSPEGKKAITSKPYYRYAQNLQNIFIYIFLGILVLSTLGAYQQRKYSSPRYAQPMEEEGRPYTKIFPN